MSLHGMLLTRSQLASERTRQEVVLQIRVSLARSTAINFKRLAHHDHTKRHRWSYQASYLRMKPPDSRCADAAIPVWVRNHCNPIFTMLCGYFL